MPRRCGGADSRRASRPAASRPRRAHADFWDRVEGPNSGGTAASITRARAPLSPPTTRPTAAARPPVATPSSATRMVGNWAAAAATAAASNGRSHGQLHTAASRPVAAHRAAAASASFTRAPVAMMSASVPGRTGIIAPRTYGGAAAWMLDSPALYGQDTHRDQNQLQLGIHGRPPSTRRREFGSCGTPGSGPLTAGRGRITAFRQPPAPRDPRTARGRS